MKKIILLGYMGSGKSTIAKKLSEKIKMQLFDLDKIIEGRANLSVKSIFEQKGEIYFRKLENQILKELMASEQEMVISLGGGTPCYAGNHEMLNGKNIASFYLKASIDTLYKRLVANKEDRPLIASKNEEEMKEYIAMHLFERSFYYNKATHAVLVDDKSVEEVALAIEKILA